jgi:hypothetical protein
MKPIVVSAAAAWRTPNVEPSAEPSVSAALPCNSRRREILPKSICLLPLGGVPAEILRRRLIGGARSSSRKLRARASLLSKIQ